MGTEAAVTIQQAVVRCEPSLAVAADAAPGCQLTVCKPDKHPIAKRTPEVLPRGVGQVGPVGRVRPARRKTAGTTGLSADRLQALHRPLSVNSLIVAAV